MPALPSVCIGWFPAALQAMLDVESRSLGMPVRSGIQQSGSSLFVDLHNGSRHRGRTIDSPLKKPRKPSFGARHGYPILVFNAVPCIPLINHLFRGIDPLARWQNVETLSIRPTYLRREYQARSLATLMRHWGIRDEERLPSSWMCDDVQVGR